MATAGARYGRPPSPDATKKIMASRVWFAPGVAVIAEVLLPDKSNMWRNKISERQKKQPTQECRTKETKERKTRSETEKAGRKVQKPSRREQPLVGSARRAAPNLSWRQSHVSRAKEPASGCQGKPASLGTMGTGQGREEPPVTLLKERQRCRSEDILLDLKKMIFLCPHNTCLTSSWSRKRGEEHHYDICRYQHQWSHPYDKNPQNNCTSGQKHSIWALLCYSCCISRACPLALAPFLQPGTLDSPSRGDQRTDSLAIQGNEAWETTQENPTFAPKSWCKTEGEGYAQREGIMKAAGTAQLCFSAASEGQVFSTKQAPEK